MCHCIVCRRGGRIKERGRIKFLQRGLQNRGSVNNFSVDSFWEPVDPIVAGPVAQDNDKIYRYMLWCYYLGQVWPSQGLLSGPSLLYLNTACQKK